MNKRKAQPVTVVFFLVFLVLIATSRSANAAALAWNTFLGGTGIDFATALEADSNGSLYVVGSTTAAWGTPVRGYTADCDAFVAKLSDNGTLIWNTFLGGSGIDYAGNIAIDASGSLYVTGNSNADWGTAVRPYVSARDSFAAKLNSSGELVWNTFLGDSGEDSLPAIVMDSSGNIYLCGSSDATWGTPVRAYSSLSDVSIAKLNGNGALIWNTFLGDSGNDFGGGIVLDSSGNIYLTGYGSASWGAPLNAYSSSNDAFVAKLTSNGTLSWNTFFGGSGNDMGIAIAFDNSANIIIVGYSNASWGSPVRAYTSGFDGFAAKLTADGSFVWNTFLGGSGYDTSTSFDIDSSGNIFIGGSSNATWGAPQRAYTADRDGFAAMIDDNGTLVWNTFLGTGGNDDIYFIVLRNNSNLYAGGTSYNSWGSPIVRAYTADQDALITKILLQPSTQATNIAAASTGVTSASFTWTRGSGEQCTVFMKQTDNGTADPSDGSTPTANTVFGGGGQIGSTGWFCVYNGTGASVTVTNLMAESTYRVMVCEYNGPAASEQYNKSEATGNPANITTLCELNVIPKNLHKLLSFAEPIKAYLLIGSTDTVFERTDMPTYDTAAIRPLLKLRIGQRIVLSMVFVNPFALAAPSEVLVTIGDCMGSIQVKPF